MVAQGAIRQYERCRQPSNSWDTIGHFVGVCLRHVVDRLRGIPAPPNVTIALGAQVQRLTLELYGIIEWITVVMDRVMKKEDHRADILEVVGAHTSNPSEVQMLYDAGIPVWFEQHMSRDVEIHRLIEPVNVPADFSRVPCVPRLVLAKRDLSGALNLPGEWLRAMAEITRRQLCAGRLPPLLDTETDESLPRPKRLCEGAVYVDEFSSSTGPPTPVFVVKDHHDIKTLGHNLPPQPSVSSSVVDSRSRRAKARAAKKVAAGRPISNPPLAINPSRHFYHSNNVTLNPIWEAASCVLVKCFGQGCMRSKCMWYLE